jgi:hypothetical protein
MSKKQLSRRVNNIEQEIQPSKKEVIIIKSWNLGKKGPFDSKGYGTIIIDYR